MRQVVTEKDIRLPQFRDAKLEDLEFDGTGEVVRKDRFETSMRKISGMLRGVNGLSARSNWTCEQVVEAVNQLLRYKQLVIALKSTPEDAEFYHFGNNEYIKNIDQEHLQIARNESSESHLVNHRVYLSGTWDASSGWIEYIDHLISINDIKIEISEFERGES